MADSKPMRLVFMGTPEIAVSALAALIEAGHDIACVYTQPPRRAGRGHRLQRSAVHEFAVSKGVPVRCPDSLKNAEAKQEFAALGVDAAIVIAYGLILPAAILSAPRLGCLNIHMSLLPRWRGAAPIQRAIEAGDAHSGVSIMQMDEGLDTGSVLATEAVPITPETTGGTLHDELAVVGARMIVEVLDGLRTGSVEATPQSEAGATYAKKIDRDQGRLDWRRDAEALARQVRAFDPWPGTWFSHGETRIRVLGAEAVDRSGDTAPDTAPGTVLDARPTIACGSGALRLRRLQRPGKAASDAGDFLRGYDLPVGTVLS